MGRGLLAGMAVMVLALAAAAPARAQMQAPALIPNQMCAGFGDAVPWCPAANIRKTVLAHGGRLAAEALDEPQYRYFACPTATFDEAACTERPGGTGPAVNFPAMDAGRYGFVQVRATTADGLSTELSEGLPLALSPELDRAARYEIVGALADGSVRPGMVIDVRPKAGFPDQPAAGNPVPELRRVWLLGPAPGGPQPFGPWPRDYDGPFEVPEVETLSFWLMASNPGGITWHAHDIAVRLPPRWVGDAPAVQEVAGEPGGTLGSEGDDVAAAGRTDGSPSPQLRWQWERCDDAGCTDIPGATSPTYVVSAGDGGFRLQRSAVAVNSEGSIRRATLRSAVVPRSAVSVCAQWAKSTGSARVSAGLLSSVRRAINARRPVPLTRLARRLRVGVARDAGRADLRRVSVVRSLSGRRRVVLVTGQRVTSSIDCRELVHGRLVFTVVERGRRTRTLTCSRRGTMDGPAPACDAAFARRLRRR